MKIKQIADWNFYKIKDHTIEMASVYPLLQRQYIPVNSHEQRVEYNSYNIIVGCYNAILETFKHLPIDHWETSDGGWYYEVRDSSNALLFSSLNLDLNNYSKHGAIEAGKKEIDRIISII